MGRVCYHSMFADVSKGEYSGSPVAVKRLRGVTAGSSRYLQLTTCQHTHSPTFTQRLCREVIGWRHLIHPNILPLLGVSLVADSNCFNILTDWMPNGNLIQYTKSNPMVNRLQLVSMLVTLLQMSALNILQLSGVMSGVAYLHMLKIVHGDLKGVNPRILMRSLTR